MTDSALYVGNVRHRRMGGPKHEFSHTVWYALLDLSELPGLDRCLPFFSHNRFNLVGFDDRDHMGPTAGSVREKLERWLRSCGVENAPTRVMLLTHLRVLGHVFNPVSFFFVWDEKGLLRWVVAEVNNTLSPCRRR